MGLAVITGGSGGIGLELARLFAADRHDLVLVARSAPALATVCRELSDRHGVRAWPLPVDLAEPNAAEAVMKGIRDCAGGEAVTALVNNAGFGLKGRFVETPPDQDLQMIQVNITALTHLTRLVLPGMLERRQGMILNIASTAAFQPGPLMSVYYASKAYVLSFSLALSVELEGTGVSATVLCPGPTATGFQARAGLGGTALSSRTLAMDSATVARSGYNAMKKGKPMVTPGAINNIGAVAAKLAPRMLAARVAKLSQEARHGS